jgi:hypothetical protein
MQLSRRGFLAGLGLVALGALDVVPAMAGAGRGPLLLTGAGNGAAIFSLAAQRGRHVPLKFMPHGFFYHPSLPHQAMAVEKWGTHAALIDIDDAKLIRELDSPAGMAFYGHGVYAADGRTLFITRVDYANGQGYLAGYDPETLKEKSAFQVAPGGLHESHLLPDGTALVTSSGIRPNNPADPQAGPRVAPSALLRVDLADGRVLETRPIKDEAQIIGHFGLAADGTVVVLTTPRAGTVAGTIYFARPGEALREVALPEKEDLRGEMLSVALSEKTGHALVTNPGSGTVLMVDMKNGVLRKTFEQEAKGMAYDQKHFIATSGKALNLLRDADGGAGVFERHVSNVLLDGAHSLLVG